MLGLENLVGGMGVGGMGSFHVQLRCYSVAMCQHIGSQDRMEEINNGGKILLPPSCLDWLTRLNVDYPMMFKLLNPNPAFQRATHAGVIEFIAEEGKVHLPYWMMRQLMLDEGQVVTVTSASLPVASYAKFKPQSTDFLELTNPKVILEIQLRKFSCLTKGDIIAFQYVGRLYELLVVDVRPAKAVSIVECDMNVEFEAPEGYVEPAREKRVSESIPGGAELLDDLGSLGQLAGLPPSASAGRLAAFSGQGQRLDGKAMSQEQASHLQRSRAVAQGLYLGAPLADYSPGTLDFHRNYLRPDARKTDQEKNGGFQLFGGSGQTLKSKRQ